MTGSWDKTLKVCVCGGGCAHLKMDLWVHAALSPQHSLTAAPLFLQFWDTRSSNPMMVLQLPERCYCADVVRNLTSFSAAE